jgi:hypothetical protein
MKFKVIGRKDDRLICEDDWTDEIPMPIRGCASTTITVTKSCMERDEWNVVVGLPGGAPSQVRKRTWTPA